MFYLHATALGLCLLALLSAVAGGEDFPHWRGASRDGVSRENSGYQAEKWNIEKPLWSGSFGAGGSSPIVADGVVYIFGWRESTDYLQAIELATGKKLWSSSYESPQYGRFHTGDEGLYRGPSATPEFDPVTGIVYTLSLDGELRAWDTREAGKLVWRLNLYDAYRAEQRPKVGRAGRRDYGYTAAPLVHGEWLLAEVGSGEATIVAFDKRSGNELWKSQSRRLAGHTGGMAPLVVEGKPCVAVLTLTHLLVVRLDPGHAGETVAEQEWTTDFANNIASPAVAGDSVIVTSGYNQKRICRFKIGFNGITKLWEQKQYSKICSPVVHEGAIYFAYQRLHCLDLETGKQKWEGGRFGEAGSCIATADGRIIVWAGDGQLALIAGAKESPERFLELASLPGKMFRTDVWPHIVLSDGRLICKDRDGNVKCFSVLSR